MQKPPLAGSPYELLDPQTPNLDTQAVRLSMLHWQTIGASVLPDAVALFGFFCDPDLL